MKTKPRKSNGRRSAAPRGGFSFIFSDEQLEEWIHTPLRHKLLWLEEANRFNAKFIRGRRLEIWEAFRAGKI